jgi:hypothetical protein
MVAGYLDHAGISETPSQVRWTPTRDCFLLEASRAREEKGREGGGGGGFIGTEPWGRG